MPVRRLWRGWPHVMALAIVVTVAALLVGGCAAGTSGTSGTPTRPTTLAPTATTAPLTGVTPGPGVQQACTHAAGSRLSIAQVLVGTYDSWQELSSTLPLTPEPTSVAKVMGNIALNTVTVDIAFTTPASAAPGYLCAVTARVVSFAPLAAPIPNVTRTCSDHAYQNPGGADYGGDCGFITAPAASAAVTLPASAPGTMVSAPIANAAAPGSAAAFPSADGRAAKVWMTLKVPASGRYTFAVGLWQDGSGPTLTTMVSDTFNLEAAHEWTGQACAQPAMQAQLPPATNPPTPLLCPGAPPPLQ